MVHFISVWVRTKLQKEKIFSRSGDWVWVGGGRRGHVKGYMHLLTIKFVLIMFLY